MRTTISAMLLAVAVAAPALVGAQSGPVSVYYEGTSQVQLPDGRVLPANAALAKRTANKNAGTITEQVISAAAFNRPATEYIVNANVTGATFTMTEAGGAFDGDGTLQGPAWNWTGWTSTSRLKDGTRVASVDSATATTLSVHKRVFTPDGSEQVQITESFKVIDEARFMALRKQLLTP